MGNRNGRAPSGTAPANPNNSTDPTFPAALRRAPARRPRLQERLRREGQRALDVQLGDGRSRAVQRRPHDPMTTGFGHSKDTFFSRGIDESHVPDGWITVLAARRSAYRTRSRGSWASAARTSTPRRLSAARPAHLRRRGAAIYRALAGRRHRRHRQGRRGGINWGASIGKILACATALRHERARPDPQRGRRDRDLAHAQPVRPNAAAPYDGRCAAQGRRSTRCTPSCPGCRSAAASIGSCRTRRIATRTSTSGRAPGVQERLVEPREHHAALRQVVLRYADPPGIQR